MKGFSVKRLLPLLLALVLLALAGCAGAPSATAPPTAAPTEAATPTPEPSATPEQSATPAGTHTVTDDAGVSVEVPDQIDRIAMISTLPLASVYTMTGGDPEKIVALTPSSKNAALNSFLVRVAPNLADVSTDFLQGDAVNAEEVISLNPDVVFYNVADAAATAAVEHLTSVGIACVGFSTAIPRTVDTVSAWATLIGQVLGTEMRADEIVKYGTDAERMVAERVATLTEDQKKSAAILVNYSEASIMAAGNTFGKYWLEAIGAINVVTGIDKAAAPISLEQLYQWDPDVIFVNSFSAFTPEQIMNSTAVQGQDWSGLAAVKAGAVYKFPLGMYYWFPPCSDSPLALQWLAKTLYPDLFADLNLDAEIKSYYSTFYGIELSDEDLQTLYNPPASAAMAM